MKPSHVLVVEDEADSAEVISRILRFHGISHTIATSAEAAITLINTEQPDLLIVDLALPGMSGWEFLTILRAMPGKGHLPVVTVTAYGSDRLAEEALLAGFDACFPKPLKVMSFIQELENVMDRVA